MTYPTPYFREAGDAGSGIVCLHANASSSSQWRGLMDALAPRFHVLAADSFGAGQSPAWPQDTDVSLRDEVALLEPVFARAGDPHVLVAHSYGAAIALIAAILRPDRVSALALYEPVLFSLLDTESPPPNEADGIRAAVACSTAALDRGDRSGAAEAFIDYWMGAAAWAQTPERRQTPIMKAIENVRGWGNALLNEPTPLGAFATLNVPILFMTGSESPASSRGVARLLLRTLRQVEAVEFKGLGHMGPVTHPEAVNDVISRFVAHVAPARAGEAEKRDMGGSRQPVRV
jgi:pimeloyl-ACP methyl ester carboxylesterase